MIDFVGIIFAILIVIGGVIGYARAGSKISLCSGLLFGAGIGAGAWLNSLQTPFPFVQIVVLSLLIIVMMVRFYATRGFMPAGMVLLLTLCVMVWTIVIYGDYLTLDRGLRSSSGHSNKTINVYDDNRKLE
ncbi:transmembrane protein 14 homolog [Anopheles nili]|uniref:transmembrane protein 14 homolog n=1 Tax=Anopheles nili TaxID=185578 RepID=UPI00237A5544|nr:transmembrane protein 14 homolog [Anopheles nili]